MKKVLLLLLIIFSSITLFSKNTNATSGACSYHNGVNCNAGADWDGSVICSDGWKDSTVMYYEMDSCVIDKSPTVTDCAYWEAYKKVLPEYEALLKKYQDEYWKYLTTPDPFLDGKGYSPEQIERYKRPIEDGIQSKINAVKNKMISIKPKRFAEMTYIIYCPLVYQNYINNTKTTQCTTNATLASDGKCYCNAEYINKNSQCITPTADCKATFGDNVYGVANSNQSNSSCHCNEGYQWDTSMTMCVKTVVQNNKNTEKEIIFSDITADNKYSNAIKYLKKNNIIGGYSDGSFKPNNTVNRAEFAKILMEFRYINDYTIRSIADNTDGACFTDIKKTDWFSPYVCSARLIRMLNGYSDGSFGPNKDINIAEALKIALWGANKIIPIKKGAWYQMYWDYAKDKGYLLDDWKSPDQKLKRGEMAELIYRLQVYN